MTSPVWHDLVKRDLLFLIFRLLDEIELIDIVICRKYERISRLTDYLKKAHVYVNWLSVDQWFC